MSEDLLEKVRNKKVFFEEHLKLLQAYLDEELEEKCKHEMQTIKLLEDMK